ncbi:MAG: topoisomerase DNA-binding C4 zinc finger domain-containing protein, partial [Methylibium sp.]
TSTFTAQAVKFAQGNGIALLDVNGILGLIAKRTETEQQALLAVAAEGEYWRPTCASCGTKMVERAPRDGGMAFWGCGGFPRCRKTMPMRGA